MSDAVLGKFIRKLASIYSEPPIGSRQLGAALKKLADEVLARDLAAPRSAPVANAAPMPPRPLRELVGLTAAEVRAILTDESIPKVDLVRLGALRFSMPSSALEKQPVAEVRERILAALMHEESINILTDEATRQGAARKS
ncbi:hypothetical protein [Devosia sp.]|uniref:hypothetical protein n=1 Tax=Devosia sp. TaxID=1871048 RepID=UPI001AD15F34|nr:hypothetical protein [Devosia sp.]MBN9307782.1 hypothetical protein [Devosia sp.]